MHGKCYMGSNNTSTIPKPVKVTATPKPTNPISDNGKQEKKNTSNEEPSNIRGPTKRIPRPTSMLRPTLIGKSVEGSAMQAVTASRLRARASSRPLPPQRSVSGSGKSPSTAGIQKERERGKTKKTSSATKEPVKASSSRMPPRGSQTKLIRDLSSILRVQSFVSTSRKLNQSSIQSILQSFLQLSRKDNENTLSLARVFSSCFGTCLGTRSIRCLQCDNDYVSVKSFFEDVLKRLSSRHLIARMGKNLESIDSPVFVAREIVSSATCQATIVLRLATVWDYKAKVYVLKCTAWLINSKVIPDNNKRSVAYPRQGSVTCESAVIEALVEDFMVSLC